MSSTDQDPRAPRPDVPADGATAPQVPLDETTGAPSVASPTAGVPPRPRGRGSAASMVLSLIVVLGIVLALLALVPRTNGVTQPPVDVARGAQAAAARVEFTPAVPVGLPSSWVATSVRTTTATAGVLTWHAGFLVDGEYAAFEQGKDAPADWVRAQTNRGRPDGTQDVNGVAWDRILRVDKVQNSLVHTNGDVTTVVTGTASYEQLAVLAAALRPAA
ncbi:MAG TPA: DUF4245 domain-containing protein [Actinomycetales bacterium]|jgi:hypothetical protein